MKGVSLAIESVIILILAVGVLSILMMMIRGSSGDVQNEIKWRTTVSNGCNAYVSFVNSADVSENKGDVCEEDNYRLFNNKKSELAKKLMDACSNLKECLNEQGFECLKKCCKFYMYCP